MIRKILLAITVVPFVTNGAVAIDMKVLPAHSVLTGPHASQRLIVLAEVDGQFTGDLTSQAKFASSNPAVATVDAAGVVKAVGDGEAVIQATHNGQSVTAKVQVSGAKDP